MSCSCICLFALTQLTVLRRCACKPNAATAELQEARSKSQTPAGNAHVDVASAPRDIAHGMSAMHLGPNTTMHHAEQVHAPLRTQTPPPAAPALVPPAASGMAPHPAAFVSAANVNAGAPVPAHAHFGGGAQDAGFAPHVSHFAQPGDFSPPLDARSRQTSGMLPHGAPAAAGGSGFVGAPYTPHASIGAGPNHQQQQRPQQQPSAASQGFSPQFDPSYFVSQGPGGHPGHGSMLEHSNSMLSMHDSVYGAPQDHTLGAYSESYPPRMFVGNTMGQFMGPPGPGGFDPGPGGGGSGRYSERRRDGMPHGPMGVHGPRGGMGMAMGGDMYGPQPFRDRRGGPGRGKDRKGPMRDGRMPPITPVPPDASLEDLQGKVGRFPFLCLLAHLLRVYLVGGCICVAGLRKHVRSRLQSKLSISFSRSWRWRRSSTDAATCSASSQARARRGYSCSLTRSCQRAVSLW